MQRLGRNIAVLVLMISSGCSWIGGPKSTAPPSPRPPATEKSAKSAEAASKKIELAIALETADLARKRGMDEEAIGQYTRARTLEPDTRGIAHPLAVLYDRAGRSDLAEREYRAALAEMREDADVLCDYGYYLYSRGRVEESEAMLRRALSQSPSHRQAQINLGLVRGSLGQYDEAQRLFAEAIGPAAALHNVGMLKLRSGDREGALADLRAASERDPSLSETREVIASVVGSGIRVANEPGDLQSDARR